MQMRQLNSSEISFYCSAKIMKILMLPMTLLFTELFCPSPPFFPLHDCKKRYPIGGKMREKICYSSCMIRKIVSFRIFSELYYYLLNPFPPHPLNTQPDQIWSESHSCVFSCFPHGENSSMSCQLLLQHLRKSFIRPSINAISQNHLCSFNIIPRSNLFAIWHLKTHDYCATSFNVSVCYMIIIASYT
jgi:hypothetical protein